LADLLDELGFTRGCTVETIVATRSPDGSPSAAPMGVTRMGSDILEIKPFKSSSTYRNLSRNGDACVNVTGDPELFLVTAFKHEDLHGFKAARVDDDLSLGSADASISVQALSGSDISEDRGRFLCQAGSVKVHRPLPRVFSRGRAGAIDAVVHATRIRAYLSMERPRDVEKLNKRFDECKEIVKRVSAPNSVEARVIQALTTLVESWRKETSR